MKTKPLVQNTESLPFTSYNSILENKVDMGKIERGLEVICLLMSPLKDNAAKGQGDRHGQRLWRI